MSKELIRLQNLTMEFDGERILDGINLYINDHEFLTLLGPSGCGKSTTLRIIGGFLTPTDGNVLFDGQRINDVPAYKRQINTVFQRYALFPHLDVYDNIAFGLRVAKVPKEEIHERVTRMLEIVALQGDDLQHTGDPLMDLLLGHLRNAKAEGDVVVDVQVREQGVALEDRIDL
ncbi:MAG: ATP-binding cassette domain-containing protein, partial [Oscillospiraceae bacterium]|nr:ATP-binding cassette domain-containing protein [Oscillospiraceae bacterium]